MIFISYRISDSLDLVGRLDADLVREFGEASVFRDKSRLHGGHDWTQELEDNAKSCPVMLVVIGETWQTAADKERDWKGVPRLLNPKDWVRKEITLGLDAGNIVIPVFLNDAGMPSEGWLANCQLERLYPRQGEKIRSTDYANDLANLIGALRKKCPQLPSVATGVTEIVDSSTFPKRASPPNTKESKSSTGAAVAAIVDEIIAKIQSGQVQSMDQLDAKSRELAQDIRGRMIPLRHFFKIGPGYVFDSWWSSGNTIQYLTQFRRFIQESNERVGEHLFKFLGARRMRICISEYSRAIFSGMKKRVLVQPPVEIIFVMRGEWAEVPDELLAAQEYLKNLGLPPAKTLNVPDWLSFLEELKVGRERLDFVLFGAEAIASNGDVVFPQDLRDAELSLLSDVATCSDSRTKVVCIAEGYKFLDERAQNQVRTISNTARYKLLPSELWDSFVTDYGVLTRGPDGIIDTGIPRRGVLGECRRILDASMGEADRMRPFTYMDDRRLANTEFLVADIDHTITTEHCTIPWLVVQDLERISQAGVGVLLVTGRSAGWASALSVYLSGVNAIVCENGLVMACRGALSFLAGIDLQERASRHLEANTKRIHDEFGLAFTDDSRFRLLERTFERPSRFGTSELSRCNQIVSQDFEVIASSIHIHVRPRGFDKADGIRAAVRAMHPDGPDLAGKIIVVGDSANDIPLFRDFANGSIGVANVGNAIRELQGYLPRFVTKDSHANGFHDVVTRLLEAKRWNEFCAKGRHSG